MRRDLTFGEIGWRRSHSLSTALNALRFVVEYGRTCDELGETVKVDQYAEHVGISRSQAFRRQAAQRTCFPDDDPLELWRIVKPLLESSSFARDTPRKQAVYVASLKAHLG